MTDTYHRNQEHDDFGGLHRDFPKIMERRQALQWMGGISLAALLVACRSTDDTSSATTAADGTSTPEASAGNSTSSTAGANTESGSTVSDSTVSDSTVEATAGSEIPDETAGPFPADGSNGPNVLSEDGIVRADLTTSIGSLTGTADGVTTGFEMTVVDAATGEPLPGAAVYLWHCTAGGQYSLYEITDQNFLRGVQTADDAGRVIFTSVFPGCYPGRWPHCHFEIYDSLDTATAGDPAPKTSQLALPQADCESVYADSRYAGSTRNLAQLSLATDNVFSDGWDDQLATVSTTGDTVTASLLVRV